MKRHIIILVVLTALYSCATNPQLQYDDKAIEKNGLIISKRELPNNEPFERTMIFVSAGGVMFPVFIGEPSREGSDYIYAIRTTDNLQIEVLNKWLYPNLATK